MRKRKSVFLGGAILILLLASFLIYSEIIAQTSTELAQSEFVDILLAVFGLEDQVIPDASYAWKTGQLLSQWAPEDGWGRNNNLNGENKILTANIVAYVFVQVLGINVAAGTHVAYFSDLGLMNSSASNIQNPDQPFTEQDLIDFLNKLSLAVEDSSISLPSNITISSPFETPVSPVI